MTGRPYVPWMTRNDETILEYLAEHETTVSPVSAFGLADLDVDGSPVAVLFRRLPLLFAAGLIEEADHGEYVIAPKGRAYLAGDITADDLQPPAEAD